MPRGVKKSKEDNKKTVVDNTEAEIKTESKEESDTVNRKGQKSSRSKKTKVTKEIKQAEPMEEIKQTEAVEPTKETELTQEIKQTEPAKEIDQTEKMKPKAHKNRKKITTEDILSDIIIQYGGEEVSALEIVKRVKQDCKDKGYRKQIRRVSIYVKPEDKRAYYALEGSSDSINLFEETHDFESIE